MSAVHETSSFDVLPEHLQQRLAVLQDRLTSGKSDENEGSLHATTSRMSNSEAQKCADELVSLALEVIKIAAVADAS